MVVSGNYAYIAGGQNGFSIANISNPYSPSIATTFTDSGLAGWYSSLAASGNTVSADLYGAMFGDLKVFDTTQPGSPAFVGQLSGITESMQVLQNNGYAYLIGNGYDTNQLSARIVNLTTPSSPQLTYTIPDSVVYNYKLALAGTMLYGVGQNPSRNAPRFMAVDVSNPSSPIIRSTHDYSLPSSYGWSLAVNGNKAVVGIVGATNELSIIDISNVNSPVERGSVGTQNGVTDIRISPDGNYAYYITTQWPGYLNVANISDVANPVIVTNIPLNMAGASCLGLQGSELFVATSSLYVFDITNPGVPTLKRNFAITGIRSISAPNDTVNHTGYIYLADGNGGLVTLREQDIQSPDIYITDPIFGTAWTSSASTTELGGGTDDNVGVTAITWVNDRGGSGSVSAPFDSWYVTGIKLYPGTNNITATAFDAAGNSGSDILSIFYHTTNQNQTITFPAIASHTFGDAPIALDAAASSGLPVTFSVVSGPATLTSSNVLTLNGAGTVTVQASQPGNSSYNPAPSTNVSFTVALANQAITFAPIPTKAPTDAPFALTATTSSGLPVYFSVLSGPVGINSSNYVILQGAGTVSILAWQPGNSNYNAAATVQQSFTVSQIPQTIAFGALSQQRSVDAPFPIYASASSGLPVSFSVLSGPAQLSGNVLTLTGAGTVTVRASQTGSSVFAPAANVDQSLTVLPPSNTVGSPQYNVSGFNLTFYGTVGSNYLFQASSNLVNWTSLQSFTCTNSIMNFRDASATGMARRFYQIKPQ